MSDAYAGQQIDAAVERLPTGISVSRQTWSQAFSASRARPDRHCDAALDAAEDADLSSRGGGHSGSGDGGSVIGAGGQRSANRRNAEARSNCHGHLRPEW